MAPTDAGETVTPASDLAAPGTDPFGAPGEPVSAEREHPAEDVETGEDHSAAAPADESEHPADPRLLAAVDLARSVAVELAGEDVVGAHEGVQSEGAHAATHFFTAHQPGYRGWRWAVTLADGGPDTPVTISETALLPGPDALVAPAWVPWQERVRAGDLGVGDLLPTDPDDERLVPGYLATGDPEVDDTAREVGLGRPRVLSSTGRDVAAQRWRDVRGPRTDMAKAAPAACGTCGFYLPLAGALRAAFGVCANEFSPADGGVVHAEYGCGAHSDVEADNGPITPVAEVVYDDGVELENRP